MNVLFTGDVIQADTIEVTLPRTPLSSGATHNSMAENIRALFESLNLEVVDYESFVRIPIGAGADARQAQSVQVKLMSKAHVERLLGRR